MSNELHNQIYNELNLRETDDLLEIWHTADHDEWSDTGLEIIRDILIKRLGEIPPRENNTDEIQDEKFPLKLEAWEEKVLNADDQPGLYNVVDVLLLIKNINRVSNALIIVYVLLVILNVPWFSIEFIRDGSFTFSDISQYGLDILIAVITIGIRLAVIYFPLKALTHILRILMQMEFNSRKVN